MRGVGGSFLKKQKRSSRAIIVGVTAIGVSKDDAHFLDSHGFIYRIEGKSQLAVPSVTEGAVYWAEISEERRDVIVILDWVQHSAESAASSERTVEV